MGSGYCSTIKIKYGNMTSRIQTSEVLFAYTPPVMQFSTLEDTVRRKFKIPKTSELNMVYTDIDGDEVIITDDDDIRVAFSQKLSPLCVTVFAPEPNHSAHDASPPLAGDLAAEIILKLDQILLAVNKKLVEPKVEVVTNTESAKAEDHVLEGVEASTVADSTTKPSEDLTPSEDWTDIAQSGYDSEFLRRATILRQRVIAD